MKHTGFGVMMLLAVLIAGMGCGGCGEEPVTTGLSVGFSFEKASDAYAAGFTGFVAFDEGNGPIVPIRRAKVHRKGFMDRPTTRVGVKDPVFGVENGFEIHFSAIPNLKTIYVGSRRLSSKDWIVQAFPIGDVRSPTDSARYVIPVAQLGSTRHQVDAPLHTAVMKALEACEKESLQLQNKEP